MNTDIVLALLAALLFFLAGMNVTTPVRLEWMAAAALTLTLVF